MPEYIPTDSTYIPTTEAYTMPPEGLNNEYVPMWWAYQEFATPPTLDDFNEKKDGYFADRNAGDFFYIFDTDAFSDVDIPTSEDEFTSLHYNSDVFLLDFTRFLSGINALRNTAFATGGLETKIQYGLIVEANDLLTNKLASQNSALIESNKILKVLNEMFGIYNKQGEPITIKVTLNDDTVEEALSDTLVPGDGVNEYFHETTSTLTADDYEDLNALYHTLSSELLSSIRDSDLQDEIQGVISKFEDFYTTEEIDDAQLILLQDNWQNDKDDDGDHSAVGASFRNSIIALESQNDNARDELRKAMFTFQEFYKTAASLIFKLTNVLEKIAGKI